MSYSEHVRAVLDSSLSGPGKLVLVALIRHQNPAIPHGPCWPSLALLARETSSHRTTVLRHLAELEAAGWMRSEHSAGRSTRYFLRFPVPVAESDSTSRSPRHEDSKEDPLSDPPLPPYGGNPEEDQDEEDQDEQDLPGRKRSPTFEEDQDEEARVPYPLRTSSDPDQVVALRALLTQWEEQEPEGDWRRRAADPDQALVDQAHAWLVHLSQPRKERYSGRALAPAYRGSTRRRSVPASLVEATR